ncbi:unnamed protein product, partial [Mesorhabditis spiculigera]
MPIADRLLLLDNPRVGFYDAHLNAWIMLFAAAIAVATVYLYIAAALSGFLIFRFLRQHTEISIKTRKMHQRAVLSVAIAVSLTVTAKEVVSANHVGNLADTWADTADFGWLWDPCMATGR